MKLSNMDLLLADNRGTYIPQHFAEGFDMAEWHVSEEDAEILRAGPKHEWYWEIWANVEGHAYRVADGRTYHLHLDGDLFAVAYDALTDDEYREFFGEDRHYTERN